MLLFKSYRVKGRINPWFTQDLSKLLHNHNMAWARARKTNLSADWLAVQIRKAKADHFLSQTTKNLNNPSKFWDTIKSLSGNDKGVELPPCVVHGAQKVADKVKMLDCLNEHFMASGFIFESLTSIPDSPDSLLPNDPALADESSRFSFNPVLVTEVHKALRLLDTMKSAGPDRLDPYFLKLAADVIAPPLTHIFNLGQDYSVSCQ